MGNNEFSTPTNVSQDEVQANVCANQNTNDGITEEKMGEAAKGKHDNQLREGRVKVITLALPMMRLLLKEGKPIQKQGESNSERAGT